MQVPTYDRRRRDPNLPGAKCFCSRCGFAATLVSTDPAIDALDALDLMLESGCTGCPDCPGELSIVVPTELARLRVAPSAGLH